MRKFLLFFLFVTSIQPLFSQNPWKQLTAKPSDNVLFTGKYKPPTFKLFKLDEAALIEQLSKAPMERTVSVSRSGLVIAVPNADGHIEQYKVVEAPVMDPALSARYPNIRSYAGKGIDDPSSTIRFDVSPRGFHAMIVSAIRKTIFIDPVGDNERAYVVFARPDISDSEKKFICSTPETAQMEKQITSSAIKLKNADDGKLRTYRLALACTGEYAQYFLNGTETTDAQRKAKVLAAMNSLLTRTDVIYERDFGVRMVLIANNDAIIYLNASTDPWTTEWNSKTQTTIDNVIGSANYDIGHLVHKESSAANNNGNAGYIGCVCTAGKKGSAFTSHVIPEGDPFVVDYTTHEMGHQFGANHTFTFSNESGTASQMEPGSGSTIMGYAGITGSNTDVQPHSDDYFHARSISQVTDYIKSAAGGTCAVITATGNATPTANAGADYTIPKSTPFTLTGTATDADGSDVLSYTWEQYNTGTSSTTIPAATRTSGPAFRSVNYVLAPSRTFPALSSILSGANGNKWEVLPSVARILAFRFTARDNHAGGGNNNSDDMNVTISSAAGPFLVTVPNTAVSWTGNTAQTITWSVAGTTALPVSCANVKISLSTDGGLTFPTVLAAGTANDGTESVIIPNIATTTARIKVEAVGNIFFDISNTNFTITSGSGCGTTTGLASSSITTTGATVSWTALSGAVSYAVDYKLTSSGTWISAATATTATSLALSGLTQSSVYDWRVKANCASGSGAYAAAQFTTASPATCNAPTGLASASITSTGATASWTSVSGAVSYAVDYKLTSSATWISAATATTSTSVSLSSLTASSTYDWRVRTNCSSLNSTYSTAQFTTTAVAICNAPIGLASSAITASGATISWGAVSGAVSYAVDYKLSSAGTWTSVATATTSLSSAISGLTASTAYDWRVRTNCSSLNSTYTTATFTTTAVSSGCAEAYEANNTLATAKAVPVGIDVTAQISTTTDKDYYSFSNTAALSKIKVTLTTLPFDYDVKLYKPNGSLQATSQNAGTTAETIIFNPTNTNANNVGLYKIYVYGYSAAFSNTKCYTLKVQLSATNFTSRNATDIVTDDNAVVLRDGIMKVYPIPAKNDITISFDGYAKTSTDIIITNQLGQEVMRKKVSINDGINFNTLNVSSLRPGVYYVRVNNGRTLQTKKVIIGK